MAWITSLRLSLVVFLLAGLAIAACGGDSKKDAGAEPTQEPATTATADTAEDDATATGDDGASGGDDNGSGALGSPFDSYHYVVTIRMEVEGEEDGAVGGDIEGDYVAPDSHSWNQSFAFGGLTFDESFVIIGEDAWYREGDGDWEAKSADDPIIADGTDLTSADPEFFNDRSFIEDIKAFDSTKEEKNGVSTRKYEFSKDQFDDLSKLLGDDLLGEMSIEDLDDFSMVIWIDDETDTLIAADLTASTTRGGAGDFPVDVPEDRRITVKTTIDVTRINDESISIEPPI